MDDLTPLRFNLPAVRRKKLTVDFDGGNQSSDAGVLLLRAAEQKVGVIRRMATALPDRRDATRIRHRFAEIIGARVFGICEGYEDAIDHDRLRHDPVLKMAVGRCPESGAPLASQSTISRFENAPTKTDAARLACALVDQFAAHVTPSHRDIFDIDDTFDAAYGGQQLTFWNAHHDERGFAPMHVYHAGSGLPVATILRPAKTPNGVEVRTVIKHLTTRIRKTWSQSCRNQSCRNQSCRNQSCRNQSCRNQSGPSTQPNIVWRGDSHYGRVEGMDWCDANGVGYIFGFPGNSVLDAMVAETALHLRFWHAWSDQPKLRCYKVLEYQAGSWSAPRRVIARIEVSLQPDPSPAHPDGMRQATDVRYVVTSLEGDAERLYEGVYCQRGQAENLIKLHKAQLASDRTSCHSATANQVRLMLHTAAFWLMHTVRAAIPEGHALAKAEFNTLRLRLLKIAARVVEHASRIRVHLPASCSEKALFRLIALRLSPSTA
jgi:Transposase DDE domain group 1